jgi:aminomuconate-semialdehyde/2-hydroxymuconate-6-semialdehyde dehydrogenase
VKKIQNFVNGEYTAPFAKHYLDNYNPATGEVYSLVPDSDEKDVEIAMQYAQATFPKWASTSVEVRSRILLKISELIEKNLDKFAEAESIDTGKPISLARQMDIPRAATNFRFFATAIQHYATAAHATDHIAINYTLRQPLGVVVCISPWNLPLYLFTWKIAPAIAAGNCVIAKPSETTPMTAYLLGEICQEAGLPAGVLNILHGLGNKVGTALVAHPEVKAISFTGSTATGATIAKLTAPQFKKISLEMGGKNPNIIFADCDYDKMLETTLRSSFANQGQICLCGSRILVESSLYERFKADFVAHTRQLQVGDPAFPVTQQGAIVSSAHFQKIMSYIDLAQQEGGKILCGGEAIKFSGRCAGGWFIAPTIIENLPIDCRTNQEEIFGPVVSIMPFDTEADALKYANGVRYGLSATIWTQNTARAHRLAAQIQAGVVWVNCWLLRDLRTPFGGMKDSGIGREGGWEALNFFTEAKNVCIKYD